MAGKLQGTRNISTHLQKAASRNNRITQQMERRNASVSAALKLKKVWEFFLFNQEEFP